MASYKYEGNRSITDTTVLLIVSHDPPVSVGLGEEVELDDSKYQELNERFIFTLVNDRPVVVQENPKASSKPQDKA